MTPLLLHPSRPLKWAAALTKALLWVVLGVWLLVGLTWGAVHFFIVPRIGEWRGELELLATRAVGVPVRIGLVTAHTQGLVPSFVLSQVSLLDAQGREALVLGRVVVAVSPRSLLQLELEQLHIDRPTLDVRRTADGKILVAGLDVFGNTTEPEAPSPVADWFFSQTEFAIQSGTLRWTDDLRQRPTVALTEVDIVVRNPGRQHLLRLDATPQNQLGERFTLQGVFTSPFLTLHPGRWSQWTGTAHAELPAIDMARLAVPVALSDRFGLSVQKGVGALRLWVDVSQGQLTGGTADVALTDVQARFASANQALALRRLSGRVNASVSADRLSMDTQGLAFDTDQGIGWTQGDVSLNLHQNNSRVRGELLAKHINLAALHEISAALPLAPRQQAHIAELKPQGEVSELTLGWTALDGVWASFAAKGKVRQLALAPGDAPQPSAAEPGGPLRQLPGRPGLAGANVDFEMNEVGGEAKMTLVDGWVSFPGVFDEPVIPLEQLSSDVRWQVKGEDIKVQVARLRLSNADLQGQASGQWSTGDPSRSPSGDRFPGVLKLDGTITHGKADRVHRYLPLVIGPVAKNYVKESILGGTASNVRFRVAGDLWQVPFASPAEGELKVVARIVGVDYAFVPPGFSPPGQPQWPTLKQVAGELVFDRTSMTVNVDRGGVAESPALRVTQGKAHIANLQNHAVVEVNAQIEGSLNQALDVVRRSPLSGMTGQALAQTSGTGQAAIQFGLTVPLHDTLKTQVRGRVNLLGNDVQITRDSPMLARTKGAVEFTEAGFQVQQATAQLLGGELTFSGGMRPSSGGGPQFSGAGTATAVGLAKASYLPLPAALLARTNGATTYAVQLGFKEGMPEWSVQSTLQGLTFGLPIPMQKSADQSWSLRYQSRIDFPPTTQQKPRETVELTLAPDRQSQAGISLVRTLGEGTPATQRGVLYLLPRGTSVPALPAKGVVAHLSLPVLDADDWLSALDGLFAATPQALQGEKTQPVALPDRVQLDTDLLRLGGRPFQRLNLSATSERGATDGARMRWHASVQAQELAGTLTYLPPHPQGASSLPGTTDTRDGQLLARLQRLSLNTQADDAQADMAPGSAPTLPSLPALDVSVEQFILDGRPLGQLSLDATNRTTGPGQSTREWLLHRLVLRVPEAQLTASGSWAPPAAAERVRTSPEADTRRTDLNVVLDIENTGALLQRFGMPGVFRGGKGSIRGAVGWQGMPTRFHIASLDGQLKLDLASGQFLKAEPGLAKLLGVLNLQSLPRRLTLDFSDVFAQGFAFDFVRGDARIAQGVVHTNNLQMKGPNAAVLMEGEADIAKETQRIRAVVVPEINAGTASLIATVINPAVGLGTFLAQAMLRQPLISASSQSFLIHGPWANPQVDKVPALLPTETPTPNPPSKRDSP